MPMESPGNDSPALQGGEPGRKIAARIEMLKASGVRFLILPRSRPAGESGSREEAGAGTPIAASDAEPVQGGAAPLREEISQPPAIRGGDAAGPSRPVSAKPAASTADASGEEAPLRVRDEASLLDAFRDRNGGAMTRAERIEAVRARAMTCRLCPLHETRTNVVFGDGNIEAGLVFVGEAPGADEDAQGLPFVGRAGQLLNRMIAAMGLKREDVYICNVLKCRPPNNRTPAPEEIRLCQPYLEEQLDAIKPLVICALGAPAAQTLLRTKLGIGALRGRFHDYRGIPVMATYHPAYVLRSYTEEVRRTVWEDLKKVRAKLDELGASRR